MPIYGLNYKDRRDDALGLLKQLGDPYVASAVDADGRVGIDYGVYGVPETYVIDRSGVIRLKHIGPVTARRSRSRIAPLVKELSAVTRLLVLALLVVLAGPRSRKPRSRSPRTRRSSAA